MTLWQNIVVVLMTGLIIAPVSAFVGAKIALRQKTQETWWLRKLDCYVGLLTQLQRLKNVYIYRSTIEKLGVAPTEQQEQKWAAVAEEADAEIDRCWSLSLLLLRAEVSKVIEEHYYAGLATGSKAKDSVAGQIAVAEGLQVSIGVIMEIAKRDLKLPQ